MRSVFIVLLSVQLSAIAVAQGPSVEAIERAAVVKTVQAFFDTMAAKDVEGARRILMPRATFHAMSVRDGKRVIRAFTSEEFLKELAGMKQAVRERMWNPETRLRGSIATIWTPYDVWIDGKFSHCGIDAFDLIRTDDGWKISGGSYTVEAKCDPSPLGPLKQ
jgi:hypothetical protein